jgi:hypothetical protein
MTIIDISTQESGNHLIQSQNHRVEVWLEGWIAVPPELEAEVYSCGGFCDLTIEDGILVGIVPGVRPEPDPDEITDTEALLILLGGDTL